MRAALLSLALLLTSAAAHADTYQYIFTISNLSNGDNNFTLTINEPSLITTTGESALPSGLATTLGYNIYNFGENASGSYIFTNMGGTISNSGPNNPLLDFFDFSPATAATAYDAAGTYTGTINGNALLGFTGTASLLIKDTTVIPAAAVTPEPSSLVLLGTGYFGLVGLVRRRFRTHKS